MSYIWDRRIYNYFTILLQCFAIFCIWWIFVKIYCAKTRLRWTLPVTVRNIELCVAHCGNRKPRYRINVQFPQKTWNEWQKNMNKSALERTKLLNEISALRLLFSNFWPLCWKIDRRLKNQFDIKLHTTKTMKLHTQKMWNMSFLAGLWYI